MGTVVGHAYRVAELQAHFQYRSIPRSAGGIGGGVGRSARLYVSHLRKGFMAART